LTEYDDVIRSPPFQPLPRDPHSQQDSPRQRFLCYSDRVAEPSQLGSLYSRGRKPMARELNVALLMTASGSLDIFLTRLLRKKLFL